jgi:hypothetical protein
MGCGVAQWLARLHAVWWVPGSNFGKASGEILRCAISNRDEDNGEILRTLVQRGATPKCKNPTIDTKNNILVT